MEKVTKLQPPLKWSVISSTHYTDVVTYVKFLDKLVKSCDARRTEFIFVGQTNVYIESLFKDKNCIIVAEEPGECYQNTGLKYATAEDVTLLDNNVIVPSNFLVRLSYCLATAKDSMPYVGIVVPVTTLLKSGGPQANVKTNNPDQVDTIQSKLDEKFIEQKPWVITSTISDFCIMLKKSVYEDVGCFDNSINGDLSRATDWCIKALDKGYNTCLAGDIFVNREVTSFEEHPHLFLPTKNEQKLSVGYRAQIDNESQFVVFIESLKKAISIADYIFVLDANSKYKVRIRLQEDHPDLWSKITAYEKYSRPYDEKHDYNDLLSMISKTDTDWVIMLEDCEVLENKVDRTLLNKLMNPINKQVRAYTFNHYYMWGDPNKYRLDGIWSQIHDIRFFKYNSRYRITKPGNLAAICGHSQRFPVESTRDTSIRVRNYAFYTPEQRQAKKDIFERMNRSGKENFDYFTSEHKMELVNWIEDSTISTYAPVNQVNSRLYEWLDHIWYFSDEVVIGNDGLDEATLSQLENFDIVHTPTSLKTDFADGRNIILKKCSKEYILQLDVDERLEGYSWFKIRRMIDLPAAKAWMFEIDNLQKDGSSVKTSTIRLFRNSPDLFYWGMLHETLDDFIRKAAWPVVASGVKLIHYGYLWATPESQFNKMQRYLELNIAQMKKFPNDARAYYNLALHFLEDELYDEGFKLLQLACALPPTFALPLIELSKSFIKRALDTVVVASRYTQSQDTTTREGLQNMANALNKMKPIYISTAPNHCKAYFQRQPQKLEEVRQFLQKVESAIVARANMPNK